MNGRLLLLCLSGMLCLSSLSATASDAPGLVFQPAKRMLAGAVADGTLIGQGRLNTLIPGGGSFKVWCGAASDEVTVSACQVQGRNDGHHTLHVRLEKDAGTPGSQNGKSILLSGGAGDNTFSIVAAGNQNIGADSYPVVLGAQALSQTGTAGSP